MQPAATYGQITIETPENISFEYELAGPGTRMVAYFIDFFIVIIGLSIISSAYFYIAMKLSDWNDPFHSDLASAIMIAISSLTFPLGGYWTVFELLWSGQTPGKRIMGIRVIQSNGLPVALNSLLLRNFFRLADCFFPFQFTVGLIMLVFNQKHQRLGDLVAGTVVVKDRKAISAKRFAWKASPAPPDQLRSQLEVSKEEFDFISEYISVWKKLSEAKRSELSQKILKPIIERNRLWEDPVIGPKLKNLEDEIPPRKYLHAEKIMRDILDYFVNQDQ